ncbi:MAG: hypothetical protein IJR68_03310 [Fretibacterium sp.]|jgi:hypothetical protein|nr:hypothetical protein [Fretibacterium sp.]
MKKGLRLALRALLLLVLGVTAAQAADVALTSVGQSPDTMMVRVVLKNTLKLDPTYNAMMKAGDLKDEKVLIAVVGGSSKGLGAAGINPEDEAGRAKALLKAARDGGKKVLIMHVGGEGRRGTLSDMFIREAVPYADALIVVDGGNDDGLFNTLAKSLEIKTAPNVKGTNAPLKDVLAGWGILK